MAAPSAEDRCLEGPRDRSGGLRLRGTLISFPPASSPCRHLPWTGPNQKPEDQGSLLIGLWASLLGPKEDGEWSVDLQEQNEASQEGHLPADATGTSVTLRLSLPTQRPGSHAEMVPSQGNTEPPPPSNHSPVPNITMRSKTSRKECPRSCCKGKGMFGEIV